MISGTVTELQSGKDYFVISEKDYRIVPMVSCEKLKRFLR